MKQKDTRILNFSTVIAYTLLFLLIAALIEAIARVAISGVPSALDMISLGLAETGFSVTVIAVSILTVITNLSEKRYFGIKAGEYLKFKRRKFMPGFYDNLVIIILIGALQYAALALTAKFAAAVLFIEIIAMMIVQIRWGLGIAFFYYGKGREIRTFFIDELNANIRIVLDEKSKPARKERADQAVSMRVDQLFVHTKQAASLRESTELNENLGLLAHVLKTLLVTECHNVWHNYETRLDFLLSSLMQDTEQREYALAVLDRMLDIVIQTMDNDSDNNGLAKNCDFDHSRNAVYKILSEAETKIVKPMFEQQIFYKLAVVKIYGIENEQRKVLRYRAYAELFAQSAAASPYLSEVAEMISQCIAALAPVCFSDGRINEAGYYTCLLIEALNKEEIDTNVIAQTLMDTYFSEEKDAEQTDKKLTDIDLMKQKSVFILMLAEQDILKIKPLPNIDDFNDNDKKAACNIAKLLNKKIDLLECN